MLTFNPNSVSGNFLTNATLDELNLKIDRTYTFCQIVRRFLSSLFFHTFMFTAVICGAIGAIAWPILLISLGWTTEGFYIFFEYFPYLLVIGTLAWAIAAVAGIDKWKAYHKQKKWERKQSQMANPVPIKQPGVIMITLKAIKEKVCPLVTFKEQS